MDISSSPSKITNQELTPKTKSNLRSSNGLFAALMGLAGIFLTVGFFLMTWVDALGYDENVNQDEEFKLSAAEIWAGQSYEGDKFTLKLNSLQNSDFQGVRWLDRTLILLPIGGVILIFLAAKSRRGNLRNWHMALIAALPIILFVYPFVWENLSTRLIRDDIESVFRQDNEISSDDEAAIDEWARLFEKIYSTNWAKIVAGIAFIGGIGTLQMQIVMASSASLTSVSNQPVSNPDVTPKLE